MEIFKSWLVNTYIAHRGLHNELLPENSLGAFDNAVKNNYAIELDVHQISDGTIVVFHDDSLSRMTGRDGYVKNLKQEDLESYKLQNSEFSIPTFKQVLDLVNAKVPILIEIKNSAKVGELENELLKLLKEYKGEYAVQSFNPYVLQWFKEHSPEILRGQLSGSFKGENTISWFKRFALKTLFMTKKIASPNFISYEAKALPNIWVKKFKKIPLLAWTVRNQEEYLRVIKYSDNIIFENFEPKI